MNRYEEALNFLGKSELCVPTARIREERKKRYHVINELVKRTTAKTVHGYTDTVGDHTVPNGTYDFVVCECPECGNEIENIDLQPDYCMWCGQALRWPDDN